MCRARVPSRVLVCAAALVLPAGPGESADPPKDPAPKPPAAEVNLDDYLLPDPDVEWLKRSKVPTDSPGLVRFLKSCQGPETPPAEIEALVGKLMGKSAADQEAAAKKLAEVGTIAVPALRRHRTGPDTEAAKRVRDCLEKIEEAGDKPLARPAMRLLVARKAAGAAEALLGYLPFASDPAAEEDVYYGLDALAERDPKMLAVLAGALKEPQPARRAVAACLLGRRGDAGQKQAVRDLLKDPDSVVRLRAAQGLLAGKDKGVLPILIDLLDDPEVEVRWQAEELLRWAAIDTAPAELAGSDDPAARRACQAAWRKWWAANGAKLDLAEVEKEPRRPLLLLGYDRKAGRVWVFGSDGATRHEWTTKENLADAQYVPGGTVLTLHEQPVRQKPLLAERDRGGKVLWQYEDMADPKYCQQLSNGHIFVAERQDIAEPNLCYQILAPGGRVVGRRPERCSAPGFSVAMRQTTDGLILCAWFSKGARDATFSALYEYDPAADTTRDLKLKGQTTGPRPWVEDGAGGSYLLSGLVPHTGDEGEIVETAPDGFILWAYRLPGVTFAARLRGGNTVASLPNRLVELTPDKRMVGEFLPSGSLDVARPVLGLVRFGFDPVPQQLDLAKAVDCRVQCLRRTSKRVRVNALARLTELGPDAAGVIPELQRCQGDPDLDIRTAAAKAVEAAGLETIPRLVGEAKDPDPARRSAALMALANYERAPRVLDTLLAGLRDGDLKVRMAAVTALGITESDPQRRDSQWKTSGRLRREATRIVPALMQIITSETDNSIRARAINSLGRMGPDAKPAVPLLINCLKDSDPSARGWSATALGHIGPVTDAVLPALEQALTDRAFPRVRVFAAEALGMIGPAAKDSVERLIGAYKAATDAGTENATVAIRQEVLRALGRTQGDDDQIVPFLTGVLADDSLPEKLRVIAAEALAQLGPGGVPAIPLLDKMSNVKEGLRDQSTYARCAQQLRHAMRRNERG